ncbi:MAG: hypothetical protein K6U03_04570 [Firmicutes bacterium]|nr:hypothetical protein [Bacillota bacterium]
MKKAKGIWITTLQNTQVKTWTKPARNSSSQEEGLDGVVFRGGEADVGHAHDKGLVETYQLK